MKKVISVTLFGIAFLIFNFFPLPKSIHNTSYSFVLASVEGELLAARIAEDEQWRFPAILKVPVRYKEALIEYEDRRFLYHPGIDPLAIIRAAKSNYAANKVVSGGSTISMQLARMLLGNKPRTLFNKTVEVALALKLEWHYTKEELLAMYSSRAPYGGNNVGLEAASWRYFSRLPEDLSWAEAAMLAVLPNSPSLIHLGRSREILKVKRDKLLRRLQVKGLLDETDLKLSLLEPLPDAPTNIPQVAPHLLQYLIEKYPSRSHFISTVRGDIQNKIAVKSKRYIKKLFRNGIENLSVVVIDNRSMELIAMIGNETVSNKEEFSPHVNIAVSPRSSGSILKPLLYAHMLQAGEITPDILIPDIPTNFDGFSPQNYDREFRGAVPAKEALAQSLNIPAVRMLRQHGIPQFQHELKQLGLTTLFRPADDYGLSLILGGAEVTLLEITTIYAQVLAVARSGYEKNIPELKFIRGEAEEERDVTIFQGSAWLMLEALLEVMRPGTDGFWKDFSSSQDIAWKTGTSYGLRDAWAVGSTASYTVGVWAGNAEGQSVPHLSGVSTAAPLMFEIFDLLEKSSWINKPHWALKEVETCKDNGYISGGRCESKVTHLPVQSNFERITQHHKKVHLDQSEQYQVHGVCESVSKMKSFDWFILPPAQEYYWKNQNAVYKLLPPWRKDCIKDLATYTNENPIDLIYPSIDSKIYIPIELDGKLGASVFQAVHRDAKATLFWHIDGEYFGKTLLEHNREIKLNHGKHTVTLVDEQGFRLSRKFEVLSK